MCGGGAERQRTLRHEERRSNRGPHRPCRLPLVVPLAPGTSSTSSLAIPRQRASSARGLAVPRATWRPQRDDSKWIFGLHDGATAAQRKWASNFMATEWSLHCRGCGARRQANSQTFKGLVTTPECAKTRADSKNWFNGLLLTAFRPAAVLRVGAALE